MDFRCDLRDRRSGWDKPRREGLGIGRAFLAFLARRETPENTIRRGHCRVLAVLGKPVNPESKNTST